MFVPVEDRKEALWTVGYYVNDDEGSPVFTAMQDFNTAEEAWAFIHYLNGGSRVFFD
jgi:hypothetical protein